MPTLGCVIPSIIGLSAVVCIVWRLASRRHSLPCPVWLRWLVELDNPFTKTNRAAVIIEHPGLSPRSDGVRSIFYFYVLVCSGLPAPHRNRWPSCTRRAKHPGRAPPDCWEHPVALHALLTQPKTKK
jgi:hypothetical protein